MMKSSWKITILVISCIISLVLIIGINKDKITLIIEVNKIESTDMNLSQASYIIESTLSKYNESSNYELTEEVIAEKYRKGTLLSEIEENDIIISSMHWTIFEECYVANLVTRYTGVKYTTKDYNKLAKFLRDNLNQLLDYEKINSENLNDKRMFFIQNYITTYTDFSS